jgi:hypothetical protein
LALVPSILSQQLFDAETKDVQLTPESSAKIKQRCDAVAQAIDNYIKSATVNSTVTIPATSPPGSPSIGNSISNSII